MSTLVNSLCPKSVAAVRHEQARSATGRVVATSPDSVEIRRARIRRRELVRQCAAGRFPSPAGRNRNRRRRPARRRPCPPSARRRAACRPAAARGAPRSSASAAASSWSWTTRTSETTSAPARQRIATEIAADGLRARCDSPAAAKRALARSATAGRSNRMTVELAATRARPRQERPVAAADVEQPAMAVAADRRRAPRRRPAAARPPSARCRRRPASGVSPPAGIGRGIGPVARQRGIAARSPRSRATGSRRSA